MQTYQALAQGIQCCLGTVGDMELGQDAVGVPRIVTRNGEVAVAQRKAVRSVNVLPNLVNYPPVLAGVLGQVVEHLVEVN
mgnify:CR=1 FL=1